MPTLQADGTISPHPRCIGGPTCCGALYIVHATYAELVATLGETDTIEDAEPYWVILVRSDDDLSAELVAIHHTSNWPRERPDEGTLWYVTAHLDGRWAADRLLDKLAELVGLPSYGRAVER